MADTTVYAADPWAMLSGQHSDIRREAVENKAQITTQLATKVDEINDAIKSSSWAVSDRVQDEADLKHNQIVY